MNLENLKKLADHIEDNVSVEQFDMNCYRKHNGVPVWFFGEFDCGTVGCALGHAPFIEGMETIASDYKIRPADLDIPANTQTLDFEVYKERVFEINDYRLSEFLFSGHWGWVDDSETSKKNFINRARYIIAGQSAISITRTQEHISGIVEKYLNES